MSETPRAEGRSPDQLRPIEFHRHYIDAAPGAVLVRMGRTHVLCTACIDAKVPAWMEGRGKGWLTAEYDMLPASTGSRRERNRAGKLDGRTQEIQRLIGRSLRAVVDRSRMGENTICFDCDVIQADGGTRTAAITGAYVALCDAVAWGRAKGILPDDPVSDSVAAVSVGKVGGRILLDLDYSEDSRADVDFNVVMTGKGRFVEVQGSAEADTFGWDEMQSMIQMAQQGIQALAGVQKSALGAI